MTRDMKPRRQSSASQRKKSGGGTLLGLFIGLVLGVIAAAVVVYLLTRSPTPFANKGIQAPLTQAENGKGPMPLPGKPGDPVSNDKPRFDFYKILPGNADAIPDPKATTKPQDEKRDDKGADKNAEKSAEPEKEKSVKESVLKDPVYLQTGSFQSAEDADNQKAKLALIGAEASVQQVMLQDKVWYRVRIGPFKSMDELNGLRAELAKQGIGTNVVKKD